MEPTNGSTSSNVVDDTAENVNVYQAEEPEDDREEERFDEAINMDELPSTGDLSDRDEQIQHCLMNQNNNRPQTSPFKQILRPALIFGNNGTDLKRRGWKSGLIALFVTGSMQPVIIPPTVPSSSKTIQPSSRTTKIWTLMKGSASDTRHIQKHVSSSRPPMMQKTRPPSNKPNKKAR